MSHPAYIYPAVAVRCGGCVALHMECEVSRLLPSQTWGRARGWRALLCFLFEGSQKETQRFVFGKTRAPAGGKHRL